MVYCTYKTDAAQRPIPGEKHHPPDSEDALSRPEGWTSQSVFRDLAPPAQGRMSSLKCVCARALICICDCVCTCVYTYVSVCGRARVCVHASVCFGLCARARVYLVCVSCARTCVRQVVYARMRVRQVVCCARARMRACVCNHVC